MQNIENYGSQVYQLDHISLRFGVHRTVAWKWLLKQGFPKRYARFAESNNQRCFVLNQEDYNKAIALRREQGFQVL